MMGNASSGQMTDNPGRKRLKLSADYPRGESVGESSKSAPLLPLHPMWESLRESSNSGSVNSRGGNLPPFKLPGLEVDLRTASFGSL